MPPVIMGAGKNRVQADIFNPESLTHFRDRVEREEIIEDKVNNSQ